MSSAVSCFVSMFSRGHLAQYPARLSIRKYVKLGKGAKVTDQWRQRICKHSIIHCTPLHLPFAFAVYITKLELRRLHLTMQSALFENLVLNATYASTFSRSQIPAFLYGCAWKKERTAELVYQALSTGFKGFDVAAQPKHYREDLAGEGLRRAIAEGKVRREELFVSFPNAITRSAQ